MAHRHIVVSLLLGSLALGAHAAAPEGGGEDIRVDVVGLRNDQGTLRCAIFASSDGFPSQGDKAVQTTSASIEQRQATCDFKGVAPGTYAISFFHDENENQKLDTGFLGKPKEGYGASRNAHRRLGPPRFNDARFDYSGGPVDLQLHAFY